MSEGRRTRGANGPPDDRAALLAQVRAAETAYQRLRASDPLKDARQARREAVRDALDGGASLAQIGDEIGLTPEGVRKILVGYRK